MRYKGVFPLNQHAGNCMRQTYMYWITQASHLHLHHMCFDFQTLRQLRGQRGGNWTGGSGFKAVASRTEPDATINLEHLAALTDSY